VPKPTLPALALAIIACMAVAAQPASAAEPRPLGADAVWVWWWEDDAQLADEVTAYGFDRVYLYAQGGFDAKVRAAIAALTSRGIAVEALAGEKRWATTQRADMLAFVRAAARYQRSAPPQARLAGIHLDVEPYDLPSWDRDPHAVGSSLVGSLRAARRAAGDLPLNADVPYWFDGIRQGDRSLAAAVIAAVDGVTVMAYRDTARGVIEAARREVRLAGDAGKTATVGVETGRVRPRSVTFHEEGTAALTAATAAIRDRLAGQDGFGGIAVHHLGSLAGLAP
jgi:hypothetical protein